MWLINNLECDNFSLLYHDSPTELEATTPAKLVWCDVPLLSVSANVVKFDGSVDAREIF